MHIRNDPSFFLTNKTGAPQGEFDQVARAIGAAPRDVDNLLGTHNDRLGLRTSVRTTEGFSEARCSSSSLSSLSFTTSSSLSSSSDDSLSKIVSSSAGWQQDLHGPPYPLPDRSQNVPGESCGRHQQIEADPSLVPRCYLIRSFTTWNL
ncbi:hypothetical protein Tco_0347340 [Tanacetum coccineum]